MIASDGFDFLNRIWLPAARCVSDFEFAGMQLDAEACKVAADRASQEIDRLEGELYVWTGWDDVKWSSWQQVSKFLYEQRGFERPPIAGGLRAVRKAKESDSLTSEAALSYLADHLPDQDDRQALRWLLQWKALFKLRQFFVTLPQHVRGDGRIHPVLGPDTESGRLTCKNPNLQQLPTHQQNPLVQENPLIEELTQEVRRAITARPGYKLVCLDQSGLEWRILAHVLAHRGDSSLVDEVKAGIDPHSATAVKMGERGVEMFRLCLSVPIGQVKRDFPVQRGFGKILNFSINYGKTATGLGVQCRDANGDPMGDEFGQELLDGFYAARPGVREFHQAIQDYAEHHGYVRSLLGRYRYLELEGNLSKWKRRKELRKALNVIQNCAADVMSLAMLRCNPYPRPEMVELGWWNKRLHELGAVPLLQVHDELLFEVPEANAERAKEEIAHQMTHCLDGVREFLCPLATEGGIGSNWLEAK